MNTINYPDPARLLEFKPQPTGNVQVMETQPTVAADRKLGNLTFQELQLLLTPHFSLWEMVRSGTAIRLGIDNRPQPEHIARMRALCENVLEPLRRRFGVIRITSGFRCPALNRVVHGVRHSQHLYGEAADIHVPNRRAALRWRSRRRRGCAVARRTPAPCGAAPVRVHPPLAAFRPTAFGAYQRLRNGLDSRELSQRSGT